MTAATAGLPSQPLGAAPKGGTTPDANWYALSPAEAASRLGVDPAAGLTTAEADSRRDTYGKNTFAEAKKVSKVQQFTGQYADPMQIVLLVAGIICLFLPGQFYTGVFLIVLTLFNAWMAMNQEGKAEASASALQGMMVVKAKVRRNGELAELPMDQLVPGDIVNIEAGDLVPADARILSAATLEIDESALTGESVPTPKQVDAVAADAALGDRVDMAFMNCQVTRGAGTVLVTTTGMATEVGHISGMLQATGVEKTPLTRQLDALTNQILIIAGVALVISIGLGLYRGVQAQELFLSAVAFAVAAIPTALPAVVTAILSKGSQTLAEAGAIMKRLRSVETLGSTSALNSDKTGTLTLNQMTAVQMAIVGRRYVISGDGYQTTGQITHTGGQPDVPLEQYLLPMALCADAEVRDGDLVGDPTEGALVVLAAKGGVDPTLTREEYPRVATLPFDAAYKMMATFHAMKDATGAPVIRAYVKGAPDQLLARATSAHGPDGAAVPIAQIRDAYLAENERLGTQGLRVMATGQKDFDPATFDPSADLLAALDGLTLLAIVGIVDPPRPAAKAAIAEAHAAGIQVRMITGDHAVTAEAIAHQLGIEGRAITGAEFRAMSDDEAMRQIDGIGVIARVSPEDKVHLVDILRKKGHVVGMTGDGVNDAPALKTADIGIAMGITGTEVSKQAAVMILTDDNYATIVKAVGLGRSVYDNMMRFIRFQMAGLFGYIATFLGASLLDILGGIPFLPLQTMWLNFTVNVFQAIGLGYGKPREGLMAVPPRPKEQQIMPRRLTTWLVVSGLVMAAGTLGVLAWAGGQYGDLIARTMGVTTFSLFRLFSSLETADEDESLFGGSILGNQPLLIGDRPVGPHHHPRHRARLPPADPRHAEPVGRPMGRLHRRAALADRRRGSPQDAEDPDRCRARRCRRCRPPRCLTRFTRKDQMDEEGPQGQGQGQGPGDPRRARRIARRRRRTGRQDEDARTTRRRCARLHGELVAMQEWVKATGAKVCIVFEGRDTAGKGGTIKRITERVSPRVFKVVALSAPTEREKSQMYVQRYLPHFPAAGEVVIFDRSWYNRAGVERVMGFCTPEQSREVPRAGARRREGHGRRGHHPHQVLARGQPRRADAPPGGPHPRPAQGLEADRHGPQVVQPLVRLLAGTGRDARGDRHAVGALVRRAHRRQEARPAQHHQPPAEPGPVHGAPASRRQAAEAPEGRRIRRARPAAKDIPTPF